ncbi:hypothetical protein D3C73_1254430 [compost metagenome]
MGDDGVCSEKKPVPVGMLGRLVGNRNFLHGLHPRADSSSEPELLTCLSLKQRKPTGYHHVVHAVMQAGVINDGRLFRAKRDKYAGVKLLHLPVAEAQLLRIPLNQADMGSTVTVSLGQHIQMLQTQRSAEDQIFKHAYLGLGLEHNDLLLHGI